MHKEIFTFSLADCELNGNDGEKAYIGRLNEHINNMICKSTDILFFGTSISPDLIALAELQRNVGETVKAQIKLEPLPEETGEDIGFTIKIHHGDIDITSPIFTKDCVVSLTLQYDSLVFRHLFKDGEYLQAIKF